MIVLSVINISLFADEFDGAAFVPTYNRVMEQGVKEMKEAVAQFDAVLEKDPTNPQALVQGKYSFKDGGQGFFLR